MLTSTLDPTAIDRLTAQDWKASNTTTAMPEVAFICGASSRLSVMSWPFPGGEIVVESSGPPPTWVQPTIESLANLLALERGWDSYDGDPIDHGAIKATLGLIFEVMQSETPTPAVVPTSRGGVQLEWHTRGVDFEIELLSATRISGFFQDHTDGSSWEKDLHIDLQPVVDAIGRLSRDLHG